MSLEQSTTIFVFILSVIFLGETLKIDKILSVGVCVLGVITVAIGDQLQSKDGVDSVSKYLLIILI